MSPAELPYRAARLIAAHVESIAPRRRSIPSPDRGPWATRWVHAPEGIDAAPYVAAADRIVAGGRRGNVDFALNEFRWGR